MSIVEVEPTEAGLRKLRGALCCSHCGGLLIPSPSGAVCEKWDCGGIQWAGNAGLFAGHFELAQKLSNWLALPEATFVRIGGGHYLVSGVEGKFTLTGFEAGAIKCRRKPSASRPMPVQYFKKTEDS